MRMVTAIVFSFSLLFASMVTSMAPSIAHAAPIIIKFSHVVAEDTPKGMMANRFRDLVREKFADRIRVDVYPDARLANDSEAVGKIMAGEIEMVAPALSKLGKYTGKLALFDLPFLFTGIEAVDRFHRTEQGRSLLKSMENFGLAGLGYLHNGMKQLSASRPLWSPSDAEGLKFRVQPSEILVLQFETLGAVPLERPFPEVYPLLKGGEIDGQENTWSNIYSERFYEVQEYITESNHGYLGYMVLTNTKFWDAFEPDVRKELEKMVAEAIAFGNRTAARKSITDRQAVAAAGKAEIIELEDEAKAKWIEAMKPVWKQYEAQFGKEMIDAAHASNYSGSFHPPPGDTQ